MSTIISQGNPPSNASIGDGRRLSKIAIDIVMEDDVCGKITAWAASLPGAVAEARSKDEAVRELLAVVEEQLAIYAADGMPIPWARDYELELAPDTELLRAYIDA